MKCSWVRQLVEHAGVTDLAQQRGLLGYQLVCARVIAEPGQHLRPTTENLGEFGPMPAGVRLGRGAGGGDGFGGGLPFPGASREIHESGRQVERRAVPAQQLHPSPDRHKSLVHPSGLVRRVAKAGERGHHRDCAVVRRRMDALWECHAQQGTQLTSGQPLLRMSPMNGRRAARCRSSLASAQG